MTVLYYHPTIPWVVHIGGHNRHTIWWLSGEKNLASLKYHATMKNHATKELRYHATTIGNFSVYKVGAKYHVSCRLILLVPPNFRQVLAQSVF